MKLNRFKRLKDETIWNLQEWFQKKIWKLQGWFGKQKDKRNSKKERNFFDVRNELEEKLGTTEQRLKKTILNIKKISKKLKKAKALETYYGKRDNYQIDKYLKWNSNVSFCEATLSSLEYDKNLFEKKLIVEKQSSILEEFVESIQKKHNEAEIENEMIVAELSTKFKYCNNKLEKIKEKKAILQKKILEIEKKEREHQSVADSLLDDAKKVLGLDKFKQQLIDKLDELLLKENEKNPVMEERNQELKTPKKEFKKPTSQKNDSKKVVIKTNSKVNNQNHSKKTKLIQGL